MGIEVAIGLSVLSAGMSGAQAISAKKNAKETEREQKKQLALQRRVELTKARREARIKAAQFNAASSGAGMGGSVIQGFEKGGASSMQGGFETAESQYALQRKQYEIASDANSEAAFFNFGQSVVAAGSSLYQAGAFDSTPTSTQVTAANRPGSTGTPMYFLPNA